MRALIQRVDRADVTVNKTEVGRCARGLVVLLGAMDGDTQKDVDWTVRKILALRIFPDADGKMNRSVVDEEGEVLLVSQFTLAADVRKGTRPSIAKAMSPEEAKAFFSQVESGLRARVPVMTGEFGAMMKVSLVNDGPVTIWLDSRS